MDFKAYLELFHQIVSSKQPLAPYDQPMYMDYTKLNWSRMNRWLKRGVLTDDMITAVRQIGRAQQWIVITEPWCGDAAHIVPFLHLIAQENPLIEVSYELRDSDPHRIHEYLTNGSKSIPKLIIRDENQVDIAVWGPRPEDCHALYEALSEQGADFETVKTA